ncbi:MAG: EAL domain-containing protein [Pseudomonadota bacterium]
MIEDPAQSDRARAERAEAAYERILQGLEALPVGFCIWDRDDRLVVCNESYRELLGGIASIIQVGLTMEELARTIYRHGQADGNMTEQEWVRHRLDLHHSGAQSDETHDLDGRAVRVERVTLASGDIVGTRVDVTDLRDTQEELTEKASRLEAATRVLSAQALRDPLTQIDNRRAWDVKLPELLKSAREHGEDVLIFCLDIDGFKPINDTFGHAVGDAVLVKVSKRLHDVFGRIALVARAGGDEFLAAVPVSDGFASAASLARKLVNSIGRPIQIEDANCNFGVGVGVTVCSRDTSDADAFLREADAALYEAKRTARNSFKVFDCEMRSKHLRERALSSDLANAIEDRQLVPFFQAKISTRTGRIAGFEALARWQHPNYGLLTPADFIPIAEGLRLTARLDEIILNRAAKEIAPLGDVNLSVNLSASRLREPDFLSHLAELPIDYNRLSLELVESAFLDNPDPTLQWNLDAIRDMGIGIDLDDFGSGHASIIALLNIRPKRLKIDRNLVSEIDTNSQKKSMIACVISMARTMETQVVAEGVETEAQSEILMELGCDELQGFLFHKPTGDIGKIDLDRVHFDCVCENGRIIRQA